MKSRPLTLVGAFLFTLAIFLAWSMKEKPETTIKLKSKTEVTRVASAPKKGKNKDQEQVPVSAISPEVQSRLAAAGFKTDSFIAVETKKH